eukprot:3933491-Rhodomonas_salina.1
MQSSVKRENRSNAHTQSRASEKAGRLTFLAVVGEADFRDDSSIPPLRVILRRNKYDVLLLQSRTPLPKAQCQIAKGQRKESKALRKACKRLAKRLAKGIRRIAKGLRKEPKAIQSNPKQSKAIQSNPKQSKALRKRH